MNLKEQLNKIDHYCIDNDLHFYDLRSLYEAVEPRLSGEDKSELKKFLSNPNITVSDVNNKISTLTNEALDTDNGKMYKNLDTGEIFSLDEIRQSYEDYKYELPQYDSFEDYLDYLLQLGRYREGGLVELDDDYLDESLYESSGSSGSRFQGKLDRLYNAIKNGRRRFRGEKVVKNQIDLNDDGTATMYVNGKAKHIKDTKKVQQILNDFKEEEEAKQQQEQQPQPQNQQQPQQQEQPTQQQVPQQQGQEQQPQQESLREDINNVRDDAKSIQKFLDDNKFYNWELYDYEDYPMETSKIDFEVSGDWKHDHLYFEHLINEWAKQNNRNIFKIDSEEVGESDSDSYTAIYSIFITKDNDSFNRLNSMRGLFAESLNKPLEENYYDSFDNFVIDSGTVDVKDTFVEKEFDEDDGWIEFEIYPGTYEYRVLDFNGFKPRQLKIDGVWVDVMGDCKELEDILNAPLHEYLDPIEGIDDSVTISNEDDMYDDWQMGNVGKFNKYQFDIEDEPLPFESFDRKNRLKESMHSWTATDIVRDLYNKYPKVVFLDERDVSDDKVALFFKFGGDITGLEDLVKSYGCDYRISNGKLRIIADEDEEYMNEALNEGLYIKHSLERDLRSIANDFFNGRYASVESNPYKDNIFDAHIYIMNDPHDDLTIKRFQRVCREHDIETYDYSYKNGVLYFTVEL